MPQNKVKGIGRECRKIVIYIEIIQAGVQIIWLQWCVILHVLPNMIIFGSCRK